MFTGISRCLFVRLLAQLSYEVTSGGRDTFKDSWMFEQDTSAAVSHTEQQVWISETCETERSATELCQLTQKRSSVLGSAPLLEWRRLIQMMYSILMSCNSQTISQNACDMVKLASLSTPPPRERQATARMKPDQVTQWSQWTNKTG